MNRLKEWARRLQLDAIALGFRSRHSRTPVMAKALASWQVGVGAALVIVFGLAVPALVWLWVAPRLAW